MRPIFVEEVSPKRVYTFDDGSTGVYKNEHTMHDSMFERVIVEFSNGCVFCAHEWNLLGNNELEVIERMNRDSDGNLYTTRKVHKLTDAKYKAWEKKLADRARMARQNN